VLAKPRRYQLELFTLIEHHVAIVWRRS
jgi:hypothetical protein